VKETFIVPLLDLPNRFFANDEVPARKAALRGLRMAAKQPEEQADAFYERAAGKIIDPAVREMCRFRIFYDSFRGSFPDEWKKRYMQDLVEDEKMHEKGLLDRLSGVSE